MPPVEFEPTISAGERPKIQALDRAATGTGHLANADNIFWVNYNSHCNRILPPSPLRIYSPLAFRKGLGSKTPQEN